MSHTASITGNKQAANLQTLTQIIGPVGPTSHPAVDALDWLMHEVPMRAPIAPVRAEESDAEWNAKMAKYQEARTAFMAQIDLVVEKASALYPLSGGILKSAGRYAKHVAASVAKKDERNIDTCLLCNQIVALTDMRRQCSESTRYVVIHSHCPNDKSTRLKQILQNNSAAQPRNSVPLRQYAANRPAFQASGRLQR